ncbi:MAG: TonB-dependent receptor plug [Candidatus Angelobacter sp.]|nr:TonB-dependent receptor plug [Candidatus Angelobacter sp.]
MRTRVVQLIVFMALTSCVATMGQVLKGSISGTAADPNGAVIPGATVKATNSDTGAVLKTTTNNEGVFRFSLIPAGDYKLEITAPGFQTVVQNGVVVVAGRDSSLNVVKLTVGEASTTVEVTAEAPLIESTQSQVTNTFTSAVLTTMPGVQENEGLDNLALFVPGVGASRDNNFSNVNGGTGFSVNGLRGRNNDQQIDGQNNNDNSVAGPGVFVSDIEWVSQYVLVTNQFGPEYGRNAGSVVNVITKNGGNAWHGSIYGNENNSILNAMTNFQKNFDTDPAGNRLHHPPRLNDEFTGFQIGGPWIKNKLFMSGGFNDEIITVNNPFSSGGITPTPAGLTALAACFPTGAGAQAVTALSKFGPFGVTGGNPVATNTTTGVVTACPGAQFGNVTRVLSTPDHIYDFYVRSDWQVGSDTIVGRYIYNRNTFFNLDDGLQGAAAGYPFNEPALGQAILASWTHNFGAHMVNEARASFGRLNVEFGGNTIGNTLPGANQLSQAPANITFNNPNTNLGFGPATNLPQQRIVNTWQGQDNWNYVYGKHQLKAGVNFTYQRSPNIFLPNINGQFRFADWDNFFANTPDRVRVAQGPSSLDFREYDTFIYAGDDWRIRRGLTLNLGLTWTYYGQPANIFNDITTKRESNPATAFWNNSLPLSVRTDPRINAPKDTVGPSIGFAYAPQWGGRITGNGKTVIRGGYRYLFDPPFYNIYLNIATSAPEVFLQSLTGTNAAAQPMPALPTGPNVRAQLAPSLQTGVFDPRTQNQTTIAPNFGPDRVHSWSLGIEREITKNSAIEARYVGNHARDLFQSVDGNPFIADLQARFPQFVPPGLTPCPATQQIGPGAGTDVGRTQCGAGVLRQRTNSGFSNYNGVQVEFRANNLLKQLTMRLGYTYSRTLDNVSEIFSTGLAGNTVAFPQNPVSPDRGEYSFSGLDYPHTFSVLVSEQVPFFKDQHGVMGHILGGWVASANYFLESGQRYTPSQVSGIAATTAAGDFFDAQFIGAFVGTDIARPFFGNQSAPLTSVGIFAGDACGLFGTGTPAIDVTIPVCNGAVSPTALISMNDANRTGSGVTPNSGNPAIIQNNQVRFIVNGGTAQTIFGTPFGNVPRNITQDAISNIANLSLGKRIKLSERASFEFRTSFVNVFNHPNYASVDPFLEDAGAPRAPGIGFGDPTVTNDVPGTINFPVSASRRIVFGGTIRF